MRTVGTALGIDVCIDASAADERLRRHALSIGAQHDGMLGEGYSANRVSGRSV